jgi:hypothetical protein
MVTNGQGTQTGLHLVLAQSHFRPTNKGPCHCLSVDPCIISSANLMLFSLKLSILHKELESPLLNIKEMKALWGSGGPSPQSHLFLCLFPLPFPLPTTFFPFLFLLLLLFLYPLTFSFSHFPMLFPLRNLSVEARMIA